MRRILGFAVIAAALAAAPAAAVAQWWDGHPVIDASTLDKQPKITTTLPWSGGSAFAFALPAAVTFTPGPISRIEVTGPQALVDQVVVKNGRITLDAQI